MIKDSCIFSHFNLVWLTRTCFAIFSSSTTPFNQLVKPIYINHRKCKFNFRKLHSTPCYPGKSQVVQISNIRHGYLGADYTLSFDHDTAFLFW